MDKILHKVQPKTISKMYRSGIALSTGLPRGSLLFYGLPVVDTYGVEVPTYIPLPPAVFHNYSRPAREGGGGTAYYVSNAGNDSNDGLSGLTSWETCSKVESSSFSPGDLVLFNRGDTFEKLSVPSSGAVGNPIIFGTYGSGNLPILSDSTEGTTLSLGSKDNITIENLDLKQSKDTSSYALYTGGDNITIFDVSLQTTGNGILASNVNNFAVDGLTLNGSIAASKRLMYLAGTNSNISIANVSGSGGANGLLALGTTGIVIDNFTYTSATSAGIDIHSGSNISLGSIKMSSSNKGIWLSSCSGTLAMDGIGVDDNDTGLYLDGATTYGNSYISNFDGNDNTAQSIYLADTSNLRFNTVTIKGGDSGIQVTGSTNNISIEKPTINEAGNGISINQTTNNISISDVIVHDNLGNGIGIYGSAYNLDITRIVSHSNGDKTVNADGAGIAAHGDGYNINISFLLAYKNTTCGFAAINTAQGSLVNCTFHDNGGQWSTEGGLDSTRGGVYITASENPTTSENWTLRNNIYSKNFPRELRLDFPASTEVDTDYGTFDPLSSEAVISLDGGASDLSWTAYAPSEPNSQLGDPLFVDTVGDNYRLNDSSPCIEAVISTFSDGDGDQYDLDSYQVWSGIFNASVYHWREGGDNGAYAHGGSAKVKNTPAIISGASWDDYVLSWPICPTLYGADDGKLYTGIVPNSVAAATYKTWLGDQFFASDEREEIAIYESVQIDTVLSRIKNYMKIS